jgi:hypothetical protein
LFAFRAINKSCLPDEEIDMMETFRHMSKVAQTGKLMESCVIYS